MPPSGRAEPSIWGILLVHGRSVVGDVHTTVRVDAERCGHRIVATRIGRVGPVAPAPTAEESLGAHWRGGPGVFTDPTTWAAAAIVAVGAMIVVGLRAGRRPSAPGRG